MKRILKVLAIVVGVVLVIGLAGFIFINSSGIPSYETVELDYKAEITPEAIEQGEKLVSLLCAGCHMNKDTRKLTGSKMEEAPAAFGEIYSPNITQDETYGIGSWTDGEIVYLLRTGIKKDGKYAPMYMAKLPHMADSDINAIIAFLRSDSPMVAADPTPDQPSKPGFLTKMLCRVAWKPFPMPEKEIPLPDSANTLEVGKYLAVNLDCFSCHSASFAKNNYLEPEKSEGYFGGGNKLSDLEKNTILSSNLTPHKETGIGSWSEETFIKAVKHGQVDGEPGLRYPMTAYSSLTDQEAAAIFAYLKSVPPIDNQIDRNLQE